MLISAFVSMIAQASGRLNASESTSSARSHKFAAAAQNFMARFTPPRSDPKSVIRQAGGNVERRKIFANFTKRGGGSEILKFQRV